MCQLFVQSWQTNNCCLRQPKYYNTQLWIQSPVSTFQMINRHQLSYPPVYPDPNQPAKCSRNCNKWHPTLAMCPHIWQLATDLILHLHHQAFSYKQQISVNKEIRHQELKQSRLITKTPQTLRVIPSQAGSWKPQFSDLSKRQWCVKSIKRSQPHQLCCFSWSPALTVDEVMKILEVKNSGNKWEAELQEWEW